MMMKITKRRPADRVRIARMESRPTTKEYIEAMIEDFLPLGGDRAYSEDEAIIGGIGSFHGIPVTVIGHQKGRSLEENLKRRFGMPNPDGYRKALRLMKQARHARAVVLIGRDAPLIRAALQDCGVALVDAETLPQAVDLATRRAHAGDAVLLSPACASLDMFRDYAHRAAVFIDAVQALAHERGQSLEGG